VISNLGSELRGSLLDEGRGLGSVCQWGETCHGPCGDLSHVIAQDLVGESHGIPFVLGPSFPVLWMIQTPQHLGPRSPSSATPV